ncbi:multicomponent Na+:H+ antiporter subunit E [Kineococcus xinjiangensis]|uniref:Multicomponent Na+:H+ antiporter subunit E n=1 Tax=Kineococcus xinjiangensis TaxID=512762 RepID=A0A2S6IGS2_9ACTN|nr:Na+/H+ antiporter subunit E [Kineococcus xinjiangensis]PPK93412.1 multicomponent Na+:H+ antiporter subunit E [Kineococcus xinjiangensis]
MTAVQAPGAAPGRRAGAWRRNLPRLAWLLVVWLALWGDVSWANVLSGLLVGAFVLHVSPPVEHGPFRWPAPLPTLTYALRFVRDLVVATAEVARQVLWPVSRLRPAVVEVPLRCRDRALLSLVSNSITLTPGTLTLEVDEAGPRIWVHVLHLEDRSGAAEDVVRHARSLEEHGARALRIDLAQAGGRPGAGRAEREARG